eukprot:scaffold9620_cov197-Amphora_coffeaeformis.AAC.6
MLRNGKWWRLDRKSGGGKVLGCETTPAATGRGVTNVDSVEKLSDTVNKHKIQTERKKPYSSYASSQPKNEMTVAAMRWQDP